MHVTRLSVTPVKGLALHHPASVEVDRTGVAGDRMFYLVDDADTLFSIAKTGALVGLLADYDPESAVLTIDRDGEVLAAAAVELGDAHSAGFFGFKQVTGRLAPGPWDAVFSELAGRSLRLVRAAGTGHDVEPLTLLGTASTARLSEVAGRADVDSRRFRMLIEFDGAAAHAEDRWTGRHLQIGGVVAQAGGPVQRCAGTTRNPESGAVDLKTLGLIGEYRGRQESIFGLGFNFGVYASVVAPGRVRVGDALELLPD
jgi:uncharacterized protein YcbX